MKIQKKYKCSICGKELEIRDALVFEGVTNIVQRKWVEYTLCLQHSKMLRDELLKIKKAYH